MRIGIIGNMNNAYFSLTRYLRDRGYDCKLLLFNNEPAHFHPSSDTTTDEYKNYCKKLNWGDPAQFLSQDFDEVKKDISAFDFLIGNGPAPAYVAKAGLKLDIFMPYGYDLYSLPFIRLVHPFRMPAYLMTSYYQRKGIEHSKYILFDRTNKQFEQVFRRLRTKGKRIICVNPMVYHKEYEDGSFKNEQLHIDTDLEKIRNDNEILVVQHTRQVWKKAPDKWSDKGNDKLIKGYAKFLKQYPAVTSKLILFEYGTDVAETKKLIAQNALESSVIWMPKMQRKELMKILSYADLVVGELFHSWLTYGVVLEALALGKPLMHYRNDEEFAGDYPELYPMLHAHSADSVALGLATVVQEKERLARMGDEGKAWFLEYCVNHSIDTIVRLIEEKRVQLHA